MHEIKVTTPAKWEIADGISGIYNVIMRNEMIGLASVLLLLARGQGVQATEPERRQSANPAALSVDRAGESDRPASVSPAALVATPDGRQLFVAYAAANQAAILDTGSATITHRIDVPESPLGPALSKDGTRLYVTCAAPSSTICVIDVAQRKIVERFPSGHTAMAPVLNPDQKTLHVCNRFNDYKCRLQLAFPIAAKFHLF